MNAWQELGLGETISKCLLRWHIGRREFATIAGLYHPEELPVGPLAVTALAIRGRTDIDLWHLCELLMRTPEVRKVRIYDCPALHTLDLSGTAIGDDTVAELIACPSLRNLNLSETRVSDACLVSLEGSTLMSLRIDRTKVTNAGLEYLKTVLPECEILAGNP